MPKKKKIDREILSELAESLKKKLKEESENDEENGKDDESDLEESVELTPENLEFDNFMRTSSGFSAPVLERIAGSGPQPIFVGGISQGTAAFSGDEKEADPFKYVAGNAGNGEPKYIESEHMTANAERVDFSRVGRNFEPMPTREAAFMQSPEAKFESLTQERRWDPERFDLERERKKDLREREETKYEKYKPDLPKSR